MMQDFEDWMMLSDNAVATAEKTRERIEYLVRSFDFDVAAFRRDPLAALKEGNRVLLKRKREGRPHGLRNSRHALNHFASYCGYQGIKWAAEGENINANPKVYRPGQIQRSMSLEVHDDQLWLLQILAAHEYNIATALRRGEVWGTKETHIDFDEALYEVARPSKRGKVRQHPFADRRLLHPESYFMRWLDLRPYCDQDRHAIWIHVDEKRPLTVTELGSRMTTLRRVVGFNTSFQRGRAFWAVEMYRQGVQVPAISEILDHNSVETTMQYLRSISSFFELELERVRPVLPLSVSDAVLPLGATTAKTWQATLELEGLLATV